MSMTDNGLNDSLSQPRLMLVSSRVRNKPAIVAAALPHVRVIEYSYDTTTLDDLMTMIEQRLQGRRVSSAALVLHSSEKDLFICAPGEAKLNLRTITTDAKSRNFLLKLVKEFIDMSDWSRRVDFLATYMAEQLNGGLIAEALEQMLGCQVGLSKDLEGSDIQVLRNRSNGRFLTVGEMFFDLPTLRYHLGQVGKVSKDGHKKLQAYEYLRIIGKGAFGNAVLYQRKEDGLKCIIKEINMLELSASDRQMALNEVTVLAKLDHPNIVGYHDSFEKDGTLMIEMEYADGGTLQDFLAQRKVRLEERELMDMFTEMVSAIRYIHSRNILHRDLKTANIFLTKEGMVKIGDFGISKILSTQGAAVTVLGTPYYISPEMCEGKVYDEKSDIWALGCICYEMACLQKTFDGSNLPALVNKIIRGQFAPIRGDYSPLFKQLVREMLQKDPEHRPTATEILLKKIPDIMEQFENQYFYDDPEDLLKAELGDTAVSKKRQGRPPRSVLYYLKAYESALSLIPVQLPPRNRIIQVSVSNTHIIALTSDLMVFTWGEGRRGQLGHGEIESWRSRPACVEALKTKSITHVGAGDGFSVFTSDNGIVMTCGDGSFGALGHGDWQSSAVPKLVESLLGEDVSAVACGAEHIVVVGGKGDVFAWGKGEGGRLGLGHEEDTCVPSKVQIDTESIYIVNAKCSNSATILISETGVLFACGVNRYNRLGLDEKKMTLFSTHVDKVLAPTRVRSIKVPIVDIAMGPNHTVCLTARGKIISFGRNSEAQLGLGHSRSVSGPSLVKAMQSKEARVVSCGSTFTVVGTNENVIYFWGTRYISPLTRPSTRDAFGQSFGARLASPDDVTITDAEISYMIEKERNGGDSKGTTLVLQDMGDQTSGSDRALASLSSSELLRNQGEITLKDIVAKPQEILALFASPSQIEKGETVMLGSIHCQNQNIFLVVETTCPLAKSSRPPSGGSNQIQNNAPAILDMNDEEEEEEFSQEESDDDLEASGEMETWIRNELKESDVIQRPVSSEKDKKPRTKSTLKNNSEYQKRLETEYNRKQVEIRLQAHNAVREREKALSDEVFRLREELNQQLKARNQLLEAKTTEKTESTACIIQ